jgi:hypothetical protein
MQVPTRLPKALRMLLSARNCHDTRPGAAQARWTPDFVKRFEHRREQHRRLQRRGLCEFPASHLSRHALWRSPELPDFPLTPAVQGIATKLIAEFRTAQDRLIDARLAMGSTTK